MHDADGGLGSAFPMAINIKSTLASSLARLQDTNNLVICNWHTYSLQQEIHRISNIRNATA
jgi:hypothetical protein